MDFKLFQIINNLAAKNLALDQIGIFFTHWVIFLLLITASIVVVRKGRKALVLSVFAIVAILLIDKLLNFLIDSPRPFVENQVNLLITALDDPSFPSTHAAISAAAAAAIYYFSNLRYLKIAAIASAFLVGLSRIFVGVHYPSDVVAGVILGIAAFIISVKLMVRLTHHQP